MKFVVFHGSFGDPSKNWFPSIRKSLEGIGQEIVIPKFPTDNWDEITKNGPDSLPKNQNLANWLKEFDKVFISSFKKNDKPCFIGHSLGCLFILHLIERYKVKLDSAIFVAPFLKKLDKSWQIDLVNRTFWKTDFDFNRLKTFIPVSYGLYGDNDPYVEPRYAQRFIVKMGAAPIVVKGAGHQNSEAGFVEHPLVLELCKTRIDSKSYL